MKITHSNKFTPVTITVETERELAALYLALDSDNCGQLKIKEYLRCQGLMDYGVAKKVLER